MVRRRRVLQLVSGGLFGLAGCLDTTGTGSRTPTPGKPSEERPDRTEAPDTREGSPEVEEWSPTWTIQVPEAGVLGLDRAGDLIVGFTSDENGPSAVVAVDPSGREAVWRAEFEGEAVGGTDADHRSIARDGWGTTVTDDHVLAVTGSADSYDWTAVRAVDRSSGEPLWSLRRERRLAVRGAVDGTVFATGLEFFQPEHSHDTPDEPLSSVLYAIDAETGDVGWDREFSGVVDVAVGPDGVYVAAGTDLVVFGPDGTRRSSFDGGSASRSVRAADGRIYYLTQADGGSTIHGLSPGGDLKWERRLPVHEVLLDGDRLYAGGDSTLAIDPDGTVAWRDHGAYGKWLLLSPDRETLYTRAGRGMDRARAYRADDGTRLWEYVPPDLSSPNAWPVAATNDVAVVEGITAEHADDPFTTLYAVREGEATKALATEPVYDVDVEGLDGTVFVAGESVLALDP